MDLDASTFQAALLPLGTRPALRAMRLFKDCDTRTDVRFDILFAAEVPGRACWRQRGTGCILPGRARYDDVPPNRVITSDSVGILS